ncbi:MAG: hypothetical protein M1358_04490 [Chloroflexi bacterium]|nr:hypothetical protein [Chloroflexota bacterium]
MGVRQAHLVPNALPGLVGPAGNGPVPDEVWRFAKEYDPLIVSVGAMTANHGFEVLIRAPAQMKPLFPKIGAIIVAYKSVHPAYRRYIDDLMSETSLNCSILIHESPPEVLIVIALADVLVRP